MVIIVSQAIQGWIQRLYIYGDKMLHYFCILHSLNIGHYNNVSLNNDCTHAVGQISLTYACFVSPSMEHQLCLHMQKRVFQIHKHDLMAMLLISQTHSHTQEECTATPLDNANVLFCEGVGSVRQLTDQGMRCNTVCVPLCLIFPYYCFLPSHLKVCGIT